jgi:hypothetical protein
MRDDIDMERIFTGIGIVTLIVMATVPTMHAGVLYSQSLDACCDGGPNSIYTGQLLANSFTIPGGGVINQVSWYGVYSALPDGGPGGDGGGQTMTVAFFASSAGLPGAQLLTITGTPSAKDTGIFDGDCAGSPSCNFDVFRYTLNIPSFTVSTGVQYFFSVSEPTPRFLFQWADSNLASGCVVSTNGVAGPWSSTCTPPDARASQAFSLSDAPEPEPLALFSVALFGGFCLHKWQACRKGF